MRIYLNDWEFPVPPGSLSAEREGRWAETELLDTGSILIYRPPGLRRVEFSGLFPARRYAFVTASELLQPGEYDRRLEALLASGKPARLVISGGGAPFSMPAVVERYQRRDEAGEEGDLYFTLQLREYREYGAKTVEVGSSGQNGSGWAILVSSPDRAGSPAVPASYTVQKGDCLWSIARRFLGDGSRYPEIAALNGIQNASLIYPGQTLRLPTEGV